MNKPTLVFVLSGTFLFGGPASAQATERPAEAGLGADDGLRIAPPKDPADADAPVAARDATPPEPSVMDVAGPHYRDLSPHGRWFYADRFGYVWQPYATPVGWRPYTRGRWAYTDEGWFWVSSEPWGEVTSHYGRWVYTTRQDWVWIPGRVWAPAWVVWRSGPGYIGWAPLPPDAVYDPVTGITWRVSVDYAVGANAWVFVDERYAMDPYVYAYIYPPRHNLVIIRSTTVYVDYSHRRGRVINRGLDVRRVERATGRRIEARPVRDAGRTAPRTRGRDDDTPRTRSRTDDDTPRTKNRAPDDRRDRARPGSPSRSQPRGPAPRQPSRPRQGRGGR